MSNPQPIQVADFFFAILFDNNFKTQRINDVINKIKHS